MRPLFFTLLLMLTIASLACAQVSQAVREIAIAVAAQLGRKEAGELAKFGGETAVKQLFERAAREGGEATAQQLGSYAERYGVAALRAAETAPGRFVPALDRIGGEFVEQAIYATAREPALVTKLLADYGDDALKLAAKHAGVGPKIATTLGREGIDTGLQLPTNEAIRLARYADNIASAPVPDNFKKDVLKAIAKAPKRVLDEIEKHPNILLTAAGCATVIKLADDAKAEIWGTPGDGPNPPRPGWLERTLRMVIDTFKTPLSAVIAIVGIGVAGWFGARIWLLLKARRR